ncbi:molybdenum ABC transporter ATP-binding protein [Rhodobacteraceae bacterium B1Z28]|uniref:Molybdenum ABC transporter ATP-binding protein n=1 Tax=Ruegeria haliotis TaxID=2747601 RepID=A0ABX2PQK0_9RHOB|nr:molybdenum ABC transporter ATP-binding protein [Ruegeria haliotis]NVO56426.1 molybdenum ABC transporter ATP-binding protein [Ruegeria haliotis]
MSLSVRMQHALPGIDLDLSFDAPSGVTVLFGRSGSGKTTIVNGVAGLMRPQAGRVAVDDWVLFDTDQGLWLPPHRRRLGYIFQEGRLFPHLTVRQNLAYGRWFAPRKAPRENPDKVIEMLGIGHLLDRRPAGLSGGEKQRVAIGRALLASPRLILADEPLAALDDARKAEILPYFERLRDEVSVPILYVTHSAAEVARLATSVVALQDGKVVRHGPASDVLADPSVAPAGIRAVGAVLQVRVLKHHPDGLTELDAHGSRLFLPQIRHRVGEDLRIRIPAQEVILSSKVPEGLSALNVLSGTVDSIRSGDGPGAIVAVKTPAGIVLARVTRRSVAALDLRPGSPCHAVIKTVALAPQDVGGRIRSGD